MATLQEQYNSIKSGSGNKDQFLKHARSLFPEYFNQYTDFNTATNVLKSKQIISEAAGGVVAKGFDIYDWKKILAEEVKAEEKETSKEVKDKQAHAYDNSDMKNADNVNFNEIMKGFYAEMRDEKNAGKTGDEIKAMVVKNLAKDPLFYTKDGMFGVKGLGYTDEAPGLGQPKEPKGKHKASGYGDLDTEVKIKEPKSNVKDSLGDQEAETSMPKKVKEMPDKGVTGVEKKMKLQEGIEVDEMINIVTKGGGGGRIFIPNSFTLPMMIKNRFKDHIYFEDNKLYISSILYNYITGLSSKDPRSNITALIRDLSDNNQGLKGVLSKSSNYESGTKDLSSKKLEYKIYHQLKGDVKETGKGIEIPNLNKQKALKENEESKKLTISGTEKAMSMLKSELKNNGVKFETDGNKVMVDDSPKAKMAMKMVKERVGMQSIKINENLMEQKLRSLIRNLIKEELVNEISPELFKRATDVSRERGQDQRTMKLGQLFFNKFKGKALIGGTITDIRYTKPQQANYEAITIKIELPSSVTPSDTSYPTKVRYIDYDIQTDNWDINREITRADARILSLIAQHINPDTRYKSGGVGFDIKGY
jgi:hypothetical protein